MYMCICKCMCMCMYMNVCVCAHICVCMRNILKNTGESIEKSGKPIRKINSQRNSTFISENVKNMSYRAYISIKTLIK